MKQIVATVALLAGAAVPSFGADAKAGQAAYEKSCKSCHGVTGAANPAIAKMMKVDMKDLNSSDVPSISDADLKKVITEGKGKMKPVKTVSASSADDLIAYIHTFKK